MPRSARDPTARTGHGTGVRGCPLKLCQLAEGPAGFHRGGCSQKEFCAATSPRPQVGVPEPHCWGGRQFFCRTWWPWWRVTPFTRSESQEGTWPVLAARRCPPPPATQAAPAPPSGQPPECRSLATCHPCVAKRSWEPALPRRSRAGKRWLLALPQGGCKMLEKPLPGKLGGTQVDVALSPHAEHHTPVTWLFAGLGMTVPAKPRRDSHSSAKSCSEAFV